MGFKITETNNGFIYKGRKYKWGEGLIQFVNSDFSDFIELIDKKDLDLYNKMEKSNFRKNKIDIFKFYKQILEFNSTSLHINLLKDYLNDFFDIYDPIDEMYDLELNESNEFTFKNKIKTHDVNILLSDLKTNFRNPIKIKQSDYKSIIKDYTTNKKNQLSEDSITKLDYYISKQKEFPNMQKSLKAINKNGTIEYEITFYIIEEFCKYEFFKVLENNINILQCPYCNKYFISKHDNTKYCSNQCQEQFNTEKAKNDPYRSAYNKAYKYVYNYCYYYNISDEKKKALTKPLKEIYDKYRQPLNKKIDEVNLNIFLVELDKELNKINLKHNNF